MNRQTFLRGLFRLCVAPFVVKEIIKKEEIRDSQIEDGKFNEYLENRTSPSVCGTDTTCGTTTTDDDVPF